MTYCYYQGKSIVVPLHACYRYCILSTRITYVDKSTHQCGKVVTRVSYGKPRARPSKGKRKQIRD